MTDTKLLQELKKDNVDYYEILINTYSGYVHAIVQKVGRVLPKQDIEELSADVFIKIWENRHVIHVKEGTLKGYIAVMARNFTLNKLKSIEKLNEVSFEDDEIIRTVFETSPPSVR